MDGSKTVTATFASYVLTVSKTGTGSGSIISSPLGIDCGTDCSESYPPGTVVTLTASPPPGSTFIGWSGACTGTGTCTVTMSETRTVTATFTLDTVSYNLTVSKTGTGSGSSPAVPLVSAVVPIVPRLTPAAPVLL